MAKPLPAAQVAKAICQRGNWEVTPLRLQKVMYFLQRDYLGEYGERLIKEKFRAWRLGPLIPRIYMGLKELENDTIPEEVFEHIPYPKFTKKQKEFFEEACDVLLDVAIGKLITISHMKDGAWDRTLSNETIADSDMVHEFNVFYKCDVAQ